MESNKTVLKVDSLKNFKVLQIILKIQKVKEKMKTSYLITNKK